LLLEAKAAVNAKSEEGKTALNYTATFGHVELVELLKEYGARRTIFVDEQLPSAYRSRLGPKRKVLSEEKSALCLQPNKSYIFRGQAVGSLSGS